MAVTTRSRTASVTVGSPFTTRETVWCETPACSATLRIVGRPGIRLVLPGANERSPRGVWKHAVGCPVGQSYRRECRHVNAHFKVVSRQPDMKDSKGMTRRQLIVSSAGVVVTHT